VVGEGFGGGEPLGVFFVWKAGVETRGDSVMMGALCI
jgi:hypothetical protein